MASPSELLSPAAVVGPGVAAPAPKYATVHDFAVDWWPPEPEAGGGEPTCNAGPESPFRGPHAGNPDVAFWYALE